MDASFLEELAGAIDRSRRASVTCREDWKTAEIPRGWMAWEPGSDGGEVPSASGNRAFWFAATTPLTGDELRESLRTFRSVGAHRMYLFINPAACPAETEAALAAAGARRWPYVEYPVLVRRAARATPARGCEFTTRILSAAEAPRILETGAHWYSATGIARAKLMVERGLAEVHAAFDGERVVAITLFTNDGRWGYLGSAGTDPACRGRGAQSALICSRVSRAAELGCTWCISETNTAVKHSLGNLVREGFEVVLKWSVFRWDDPLAAAR